ncbi:MAG: dockerin type I repeat-containing protein [Pirellulales bacterium]
MTRLRRITCCLAVGVLVALSGMVRAEVTYRVAAHSGGLAPAFATGEYAGSFAAFADLPGDMGPVVNNAGEVAFSARLRLDVQPVDPNLVGVDPVALGVASQNDRGIWSEGSGSLRLVAREGMPAPGTASYFGNQLREPVLNDLGQVAFQSNLVGASTDNSIWIGRGNLLVPIARTGDDPPPLTDDNDEFLSFDDPQLNNAGHLAFRALIRGDGIVPVAGVNDRGIWSKTSADLRLIPRAGELAPGAVVAGLSVLFTEFSPPVLNDAGEIAFRATLTGDEVNANNMNGIWAERAGVGLRLVAREGAIAPGTNQPFAQIGLPAFNVRGRTAFNARLLGGGSGIWKEGVGGLQLVARTGDLALGGGSAGNDENVFFSGFSQPLLTNLNRVAFAATLAGPSVVAGTNDEAIFVERRAGLAMVARTGDLAPGAGDDVAFAACDATRGDFFVPVVNERGQVAFLSCLAGPGITEANDLGLFAVTPDRELVKIAQTGDRFEVSPGELQTINDIRLKTGSGGADGRGRAFNWRGDLAFWIGLAPDGPATTDGEAIVVASTSTSFPVLGDANGDGWVDGYDVALLINWWASDDFWEGDFDYDGSITVKDLAILQNNYGGFGPRNSPEAVPEPTAWLIAFTGFAAIVVIRRRRRDRRMPATRNLAWTAARRQRSAND